MTVSGKWLTKRHLNSPVPVAATLESGRFTRLMVARSESGETHQQAGGRGKIAPTAGTQC
jgi:hypothetical protein